jgi:hypothetical protein
MTDEKPSFMSKLAARLASAFVPNVELAGEASVAIQLPKILITFGAKPKDESPKSQP